MNISAAQNILQNLADAGVKTIGLCSGARNAAFVKILARQNYFEVIPFFDERSAGFFGLGRAKRDGQPVAIVTTSGTAVSELLSPVIEAYYSQVPLLIVSADRPKRLRGTGAPQAIEQSEIFRTYVENSWDISAGEPLHLSDALTQPCHINICFDEPLLDEVVSETYNFHKRNQSYTLGAVDTKAELGVLEKALVVVGGLSPTNRSYVKAWLENLTTPFFVESLSGLKAALAGHPFSLNSGERIVSQMLRSGDVKNVIRLGDIPVGRFWRDLDQLDIPSFSVNDKNFSGAEQSKMMTCGFDPMPELDCQQWDSLGWLDADKNKKNRIAELIENFPKSEPNMFKHLSCHIPKQDTVYIGNSLPIRLWDLIDEKHNQCFANRGANGIDGQISTAFGLCRPQKKLWLILGDLTTLYDFSALWLTEYLKKNQMLVNLVVINNKGGQIFSRIFEDSLFRNEHQVEFSKMAEMWGWNYQKTNNITKILEYEGLNFIEMQPENSESLGFWKAYDQLWKQ